MFEVKDQEIEVIRKPVDALVIRNFFGKKRTKEFLKHIDHIKSSFNDATVGSGNIGNIRRDIRNNKVIYLDQVFPDITKSVLGNALIEAIQSSWLQQVTACSFSPVFDLDKTTISEIQVSRYGDSNEKYEWHIDAHPNSIDRWLTLIYYFYKEPKKFKGGKLSLTNGIIYNSKLANQKPEPEILEINPENDMAVLISSKTPHMVGLTNSPKTFIDGRFSVNMWIGFK